MLDTFHLDRRAYKRIPVNLNAKIIINGKTYIGIIKNVSEEGVEYFITTSIEVSEDFTLKKIIELNFQIPSGELLNLICEMNWFLRASLYDKTLTLGMKIIDPPIRYKEFVNTLQK